MHCKVCRTTDDLKYYDKRLRKSDNQFTYRYICSDCRRKVNKNNRHYLSFKISHRKSEKKRRDDNRKWAKNVLGNKCVNCGTTSNLEFDHIDIKNVGFRVGGNMSYSKEVLLNELKKCQLLCKDCHKEKTRKDLGWDKLPFHGNYTTYVNHKCRCDLCRKAWAEHMRLKHHYRLAKLPEV